MVNKIFQNLISPYLKAGTVTLLLFAAALLYFNIYVGIIAFLIIGGLLYYSKKIAKKRTDIYEEYTKSITNEMEDTIRHFLYRNPLPICMIDPQDNVLWFNNRFLEVYDEAKMLNSSLRELAGIQYADLVYPEFPDKPILINHKEKIYRILTALDDNKKGNIMLYWMDVTNLETLKTLYNDEKLCYAYIDVDNYDELIASSSDEKKSVLAAQIETVIRQWASRLFATVVKYKSGKYFIIFEQKHLERLEATKFSILDDIRGVETDADFPASLSIGIGIGGKSLSELEEYGMAALDLALGRGGDQAVVKRKSRIEYYGGKLQTVEKRNKGKSRIMAHALRQMIDQSSKVIIMGHIKPDMDSFGSALGISRIVKYRSKEVAILLDNHGDYLAKAMQRARESGQYRFLTVDEAKAIADKDTLLIVVDTHRPKLLDCPELLSRTDKIVVIDHHRKSEDSIENATLTYMEAYASSTSELVTEILQYMGDGKKTIEKFEAEVLLAGITVDTNNFSIKTGVRTFEAASWLRRNGADTANVRQFFQTDMNFFKRKASIIADAEVYPKGIAMAVYYERYADVQVLISQAADELMNIQEVRASFVVGCSDEGITVVSARSLGEVNVQTIMEKLGGGGHLTTAGAQLEEPIEDTIERLKELIREIE